MYARRVSGGGGGAWPLTVAVLLFVCAAGVRAQQQQGSLEAGREFTRMFYAGQFERLWERLSEGQRREQGSVEGLSKFRATVRELVGEEVKVLGEEVTGAGGQEVYVRQVRYEKSAEPFELKWTIDGRGRISDFSIRPSRPATQFKYRTKTRLRLPFDGEWYVGSGGRTPEQNANHHYDYLTRFDTDLVRAEDARFDRNANPPRNEDFAAFGLPVLAPGRGRVAMARDGIPDNVPGRINPKPRERAGNFVVIDHGNGEYSFLAHLRRGSVAVRVGEELAAGRKVGECGNSGNSSGPHLHYGLHGAPDPDRGMSLPAEFTDYFADGKLIGRGELLQGQKIRDANKKAPR